MATAITSTGTATAIGIIKFFLEEGGGGGDGLGVNPNLSSETLKNNKMPTGTRNTNQEPSSNKKIIF